MLIKLSIVNADIIHCLCHNMSLVFYDSKGISRIKITYFSLTCFCYNFSFSDNCPI